MANPIGVTARCPFCDEQITFPEGEQAAFVQELGRRLSRGPKSSAIAYAWRETKLAFKDAQSAFWNHLEGHKYEEPAE